MTEPNFWIDNAGAIITAGAALLGTLGGGIATNSIQNRTRKSEARKRDRDREVEAIADAVVVCKAWEVLAWDLSLKEDTTLSDVEEIKKLHAEVFRALNTLTFLIGERQFNETIRQILGSQYNYQGFLELRPEGESSQRPTLDRIAVEVEDAERARLKLESLARERVFGKKVSDQQ